jgi:hypothetical protein
VQHLELSLDGRLLVSADADGRIAYRDTATGRALRVVEPVSALAVVAFSPRAGLLAAARLDDRADGVDLWQLALRTTASGAGGGLRRPSRG